MALIQCRNCGKAVSDKAANCPNCGAPVVVKEEISEPVILPTTCRECGAEIPASADVCLNCGCPAQKDLAPQSDECGDESINISNPTSDAYSKAEGVVQLQQKPKSKKKCIVASVVIACTVIAAAIAVVFGLRIFRAGMSVESITIDNWRLIDTTDSYDEYRGKVTSEQIKPFVAVIGQYGGEDQPTALVYVENGEGVIETVEDSEEDPSIKYRAIGYIEGSPLTVSDVSVAYKESDYEDWTYSKETWCDVLIDIDMGKAQNGLLIFDIENETTNDSEKNITVAVIEGKARYTYYVYDLPYKLRGVDVTVIPRFFCDSKKVEEGKDYHIEKPYTIEKDPESKYYDFYTGDMKLSFDGFADGYIVYAKRLVSGGEKKDRNIIYGRYSLLCNEECEIVTFNFYDSDDNILTPKYEFEIVGYFTWKPLAKESK